MVKTTVASMPAPASVSGVSACATQSDDATPLVRSDSDSNIDTPPERRPASSARARWARIFDTKKVIHPPAIRFEEDWSQAAESICQRWRQVQASGGESHVSHVALSRMKALEYERKHRAQLPGDRLLLPQTATRDDYYNAEIDAFLEAVGEDDIRAVLDSFRLAGTGGLHRQHSMFAATVSNALGAAQLIAPDLLLKAGLSSARLAAQVVTAGTILQAGRRRLRNAGTEDILPMGRADATPAAKNAPNVLQASSRVINRLRGADKNVQKLQDAMQHLAQLKTSHESDQVVLSDAHKKLEFAFAKVCHQLSVKSTYKASAESAKIEFWGNQRYLLISYGGTSATLAASLIAIMTPAFIAGTITFGLSAGATLAAILLYLGYQQSEGPSKDGEAKARRAIVAAVKLLKILAGERSTHILQRAEAYQDYLSQKSAAPLASAAKKAALKRAAKTQLLERLAAISNEDHGDQVADKSDQVPQFNVQQNWGAYRSYLDERDAITLTAQRGEIDQTQCQQQITELDDRFRIEHQANFALKDVVAAWKTPMSMRMVAARRLLKGKVARTQKQLLRLQQSHLPRLSSSAQTKKERIKRHRDDLRQHLCDLFNLELALQDLAARDGSESTPQALARAVNRMREVDDDDVRQIFCGDGRAQVEAMNKSKQLTAGEAERYTYANAGSAALGIAVNLAVSTTDTIISHQKAKGVYDGPHFNDYKFLALSQGQAQPGAHLSVGDRAAFQQREMQPLLKRIKRKDGPRALHLQLTGDVHRSLQKNDRDVQAGLDTLVDALCASNAVPESLRLTIDTSVSAAPHSLPSHSPKNLPATAGAVLAPSLDLSIELKTTSAYHEVDFQNNSLPKKASYIAGQFGIGGRQALMSVAGLPAQAIAQYRLNKSRAALNVAAAVSEDARVLLRESAGKISVIKTGDSTPVHATITASPQISTVDSKRERDLADNVLKSRLIWQRLQIAEAARIPEPGKEKFIDPTLVPSNTSGLLCRNNDQVITVQGRPIHAHRINALISPVSLPSDGRVQNAMTFAAGQSPEAERLDDFLLQGIESRQGLFQFVSRRAHYAPDNSGDSPVIAMLQKRLRDDPDALIGGRYRVSRNSGLQTNHHDTQDDHLRYMLEVTDTLSDQQPAPVIRIPITQAGLKFTGRTLDAKRIARASTLLDDHIACLSAPNTPNTPNTPQSSTDIGLERMIVSRAGIGRNATLISYRLLRDQMRRKENSINNADQSFDDALFDVIYAGRGDRDAAYVPSLPQFTELRKALLLSTQETRAAPSQ